MTVTYSISHGGIGTAALDDVVDVGDVAGFTTNADGSAASGGLTIQDPTGTLDLKGLNKFEVDDDACDNPRIFTGISAERHISRGPYNRTAAGRIWDMDVVDENGYGHLRIINDARHGNRPAETDAERVAWLLDEVLNAGHAINGTGGLFGANGPTAGVLAAPRNLDAADFRGLHADDVLNDMGPPGNRRFFFYWDPTLEEVCLFYGLNSEHLGDSDLRISNVIADQDADTFYPSIDAQLDIDPGPVAGELYYKYRHGAIYRQNADTIAAFLDRGIAVTNDKVGLATTASTFMDRILDKAGSEREAITVTIRVPPERVNHVIAGQRIEVKFTHLPGYEAFVFMHVLYRTVTQNASREFYDIQLRLCDYVGGLTTGAGGAGSPAVPYVPGAGAQMASLYEGITESGGEPGTNISDSFDIDDDRPYRLDLRLSLNTGGRVLIECTSIAGGAGGLVMNEAVIGLTHLSNDIVAGGATGCRVKITSNAGQTMTTHASDAGSVFYTDVASEVSAPKVGQLTTESLAGVTAGTDYTLNFPYAPGSLKVTIDGATVVATEVDPAAGTFELGFDATGKTVVVAYQIDSATTTGSTNPQPTSSPSLPSGGAPSTADYLVGTAQAGLSAEIVVGATPGGELGGTWASPTVDATHSGSTHDAATNTHIADATDAHDASAISVVPTGGLVATDVQSALAELDGDIAAGGIPATIFDAKGDIIAASAADTAAKVTVGADGTFLEAHAASAAGVRWGTPTGGGSGSHAFLGYDTIGGSWVTATNGRVYAKKITLSAAGIITSIDAYLRYENTANSVGYVAGGVYSDVAGDPVLILSGEQPFTTGILADAINGAGGVQTPRWFSRPCGAYLPAGDYWIAIRLSSHWGIAFDGSGTDRHYTSGGNWFVDWGFYTPTTTTDQFSIRASVLTI